MGTREDYRIVPHEIPVWKYGILFFYKIMYKEPSFGWQYLEDAVSLEEAEDAIDGLIKYALPERVLKELGLE